MRWSRQFIPTLRTVSQEAEIPSHKLMLRSGLIRKLAGGLYTFLPLGLRSLRKVEQIVREEMDRAGALEILMPALQPKEIWEESGRYDVFRHVFYKMKDRADRDMVLGPTHEEVVTGLAAGEINSYRHLPRNFYQIQTKFRDEIRPRFGLMRAKEFIMKDAYSFDTDWDAADVSYKAMYDAYVRIFKRCGLRAKVVEADTGAMGGSSSHEFMVLADAGEDGLVECGSCAYAANLEKAESRFPSTLDYGGDEEPEEIETPGKGGIDDVAAFLGVDASHFIKTLIYATADKPVAVLLPGHRDVNEIKLRKLLGDDAELASPEVIEQVTGAPVGFAGPMGLDVRVIADPSLKGSTGMITGANRKDYHVKNIRLDRDAPDVEYHDVLLAAGGDGCPRCDGTLQEARGIEVGHVFKLGTKYSEKLGAVFLDEQGNQQPMVMGCYGIGVSRTMQSVIEQSHDDNGICWPISVAPYEVTVMAVNAGHDESVRIAEELVSGLQAAGVDVLYDDRDERPGVKFKDVDLIGTPIRVSVGERSLAKGEIEVKERKSGEMTGVPVGEALDAVLAMVRGMRDALDPDKGEN